MIIRKKLKTFKLAIIRVGQSIDLFRLILGVFPTNWVSLVFYHE